MKQAFLHRLPYLVVAVVVVGAGAGLTSQWTPLWAWALIGALVGVFGVSALERFGDKALKQWRERRTKAKESKEPVTVSDIIAKQAPPMQAPLTADQKVKFAKELGHIGNRLQYEALQAMGAQMNTDRTHRHLMMMHMSLFGGYIPDIDLADWKLDADQRAFMERVEYAYRSMVNHLVQEYGLIAPDVVSLFERQAEEAAKTAAEQAKHDFWKRFE